MYDVTFGVCGVLCVQLEGCWACPVRDLKFIPVCNTFWCHILSTCPKSVAVRVVAIIACNEEKQSDV